MSEVMLLAALLLQAASPDATPLLDVEQNRQQCALAEQRLATFLADWQGQLSRRIRKRRDMLRFQEISAKIAQPHLDDIRLSIQDGDPGWVCDRIAEQGINDLKRDAIRPIFGDES